jgi:hypothetical protein
MLCYIDGNMSQYPQSAGTEDERNDDEISKKDVLREMGISYGQFYRWKRMGLIPERWFRRRSTFTGQETFLPREKVLERIRQIQAMKDTRSLEEIAEMFSPDAVRRTYRGPDVRAMGWFSAEARAFVPGCDERPTLAFRDMLLLALADHLLRVGGISREQIGGAVEALGERFKALGDSGTEHNLSVVTSRGVTITVFHRGECLVGPGSRVVVTVSLGRLVEQLAAKLRETLD